MIEYPSINNSSKAPRQSCIAFDKLDGSNIRVKYTNKRGFDLFGSRTQLLDETHPHLGEVVPIFKRDFAEPLTKIFKKLYPNERDITVFGEFLGDKSFAGFHEPNDPKRFVLFDVMLGKHNHFVNPRDFVKIFASEVATPKVIYEGNLNEEFIQDVREGKYDLVEGVICKGLIKNGAYRGNIWMTKVKTLAYFERLKQRGLDVEKYGE